jgi:hypothetical protein
MNSLPPLLHVTITDEGEAVTALEGPLVPPSPATALKRALRSSVPKCGGLLPLHLKTKAPVKMSSEALTLVVSMNLDLLSIALQNVDVGPASASALSSALSKELPALAGVCAQAGEYAHGSLLFKEAVKLALDQSDSAPWMYMPAAVYLYLEAFLQLMTVRLLEGAAFELTRGSTLKVRHIMAAMDRDAGLKSLLAPAPGAKPDAQGGCA